VLASARPSEECPPCPTPPPRAADHGGDRHPGLRAQRGRLPERGRAAGRRRLPGGGRPRAGRRGGRQHLRLRGGGQARVDRDGPDAAALKEQGRARTVLVTGCLAERYTEELRVELPERTPSCRSPTTAASPSCSAGPGRRRRPPPDGLRTLAGPGGAAGAADGVPDPGRGGVPGPGAGARPVALVKLAEGCDRDCSFCAIPSFRGRFRSRRPTEVLDEVAWLAGQGVSEVCLVAENSTSYGKDLGGREALSTSCATWPGSTACAGSASTTSSPTSSPPGLLEEMAANPVVCSYFDLSLQHASAPVLRRMRRGGSAGASWSWSSGSASWTLTPPSAPTSSSASPANGPPTCASWRRSWRRPASTGSPSSPGRPRTAPPPWSLAAASRRPRPGPGSSGSRRYKDRVLTEAQQAWVGRRLELLVERVEADGTAEGRSFREAPDVRRRGPGRGCRARAGGRVRAVEVTAAQGPELLARPAG
jgi:hypothetical protein